MSIRFMYQNLLAASMITPSSAPVGVVGGIVPQKTGSAEMFAQGSYTGDDDVQFTVEIDSISGGAEVGQATYRWKTSAYTSWVATGQTTKDYYLALEAGVEIKWSSGTGSDFAVGDNWTFNASRPRGRNNLVNGSPNEEWRSTGVASERLDIRPGAIINVTAACIGHHNLTEDAVITIIGHTADTWVGDPAYSAVIPWAADQIVFFLDKSYFFWRLQFEDSTNPDGYIRVANLFLGTYFAPARDVSADLVEEYSANLVNLTAGENIIGRHVRGLAHPLQLPFTSVGAADLAGFRAMFAAVHNLDAALPLWVCLDHAAPGQGVYFGLLGGSMPRRPRTGTRSALDLTFDELPRAAC
ncbi:MAG: hypothetical protein HY794_15765 [Desulfarculus sp.]|nr:hypothetical protein [Desulfarculus sp.]